MTTRHVTADSGTVAKNPKSLVWTLTELVNDLVAGFNELRTDHGTTKALDDELVADHATFKAVVDDLKTLANALRTFVADGMLAVATITVSGGDATKYKTTATCIYRIAGVYYSKAATDTLAMTTADTINLAGAATTAHWGAWLVSIGVDGTPHTTHATYTSGTDQDYATEAAAIAALPAPAASHTQIGYFTVQGLASVAWTATTSNFTVGGGAGNCTARTFYDLPTPATLPAAVTTSSPATLGTAAPATLTAAAVDDIELTEMGAP